MKPLVLIMGVQRSGTNALFKSLTSDPAVLGVNEAPDSAFFKDVLLRSEAQLRPHLDAHPGPVVLKPISETNHRGVVDVIAELAEHDPVVPWIYRDPVNCFHSHIVRWEGFRDRPQAFAEHWSERNAKALHALEVHPDRLAIVQYEDLVFDPAVFDALCGWLGLRGSYLFRADRGRARQTLGPDVVSVIESGTAQVRAALDDARGFRPGESSAVARASARLTGRVRRQLGKLRS